LIRILNTFNLQFLTRVTIDDTICILYYSSIMPYPEISDCDSRYANVRQETGEKLESCQLNPVEFWILLKRGDLSRVCPCKRADGMCQGKVDHNDLVGAGKNNPFVAGSGDRYPSVRCPFDDVEVPTDANLELKKQLAEARGSDMCIA